MTKQLNQQSGFTLLELLMVVIIVGILATLALPAYIRASEKARTAEVTTVLGAMKNSAQRYCADADGTLPATLADLDVDNPMNVIGLGAPDTNGNLPRWSWDAGPGPAPGTVTAIPAGGTVIPAQGSPAAGVGTAGVVGAFCSDGTNPYSFEADIVRATGPCAGTEVRYRTSNAAQPIEVAWFGQCA